MSIRRLIVIAAIVAVAVASRPVPVDAAPGKYFENNRLGCKVRAPQDWTQIPPKTDERYLALKFLSNKKYSILDKETGFTSHHQPEMIVLSFIHQVVKDRGVKVTEQDESTTIIEFDSPYKDYKDFLDRTYSKGGFYFEKEEKGKVNGLEVDQYEIKVEKLADAPMRIITWVYHTEEVDFAVQFEVLERELKGLRGDIYGCLKSFTSIPRTEGSLVEGTTTGSSILALLGDDKLSPEERKDRRLTSERRLHEKAEQGLTEGWTAKKMKRFLVINHTDDKYAKKVVTHAEAIWDWLDENLGFIGPGEYVRNPILRICANRDEERSFRMGTGDWGGMGIEIVTHQDKGSGAMSYEFEYVNTRTLGIWFQERDRDLYWALPYWVDYGLIQVLGTARSKGRRVEFKADDWEKDLREARRNGTLSSARDLMRVSMSDLRDGSAGDTTQKRKETGALVRFLMTGPAARSSRTKTVFVDYLKNLKAVIEEQKAAVDKEATGEDKAPETEEEEDQYFLRRRQALKERESKLLEEVFERTFKDWSDKDWAIFDKVYQDSIG